jgi:hypothetical protein
VADSPTNAVPPTSFECSGGVYCRTSADPAYAHEWVLRKAIIGVFGPQTALFVEPFETPPVAKPDQPSLEAGD